MHPELIYVDANNGNYDHYSKMIAQNIYQKNHARQEPVTTKD